MKKRILFFIQNGVGGAERMTINIANLLPSEDWNISFCKVSQPCIAQNGRIEDSIPKHAAIINISWTGQLSLLKQMFKVIKSEKPYIVFSSVMPYNQRLLLISPFFKKTKFIVRNDNYLFTLNKLKKLCLRYTYKLSDMIIAQTDEMRTELIGLKLPSSKIKVLQNFIDKESIGEKASLPSPYPEDDKIRFVSVGRLAHQKGFDLLIKAFKNVLYKIPDAELYIIGSTEGAAADMYQSLTSLADKLGIADKIIFTGYTDNPYIYIKHASVYVLSSRYEGLPNVLVEAQHLKTPSAAFRCIPIISRMIKDGYNGYLANQGDPKSLATAMINASNIKDFRPVYKSSTKQDFIDIFYKL